ncbi:MAG: hypothetical protein HN726_04835, partial [Candidatus Magasanikbacteria bacterium]|nr:hypothetical protein [Candidatus Magasanikbacteria bacterium]
MTPQEILSLYRAGSLNAKEVKALLRTLDGAPEKYRLSSVQQGLWSLQASYPGMSAYNVPLALRVPIAVDADRLASAFSAVVSRWPVLGGRVEVMDGVAHLVPDGDGVCFEVVEGVEGVELAALARRPFDLSAGPLLRGYYLRERGILLLVVHHLV